MRAPQASNRPMIGARAFIARSWILTIFCACASLSEPPNTVKSLAKANTARPLTVPQPVTTPSPGIFVFSIPNSLERCSTNMSNSSKEPLSRNNSMRSRAVNLPRLCCASIRALPPPRRASWRRFSSLSRISFMEWSPSPWIPAVDAYHTTAVVPAKAGIRRSREYGLGRPSMPAYKRPMSEPQAAHELIQQGLVHHRAGQISLAMDRYTQVLRNDPRNADALYYIAVVACGEGQFQQGIDLAHRSLAYRPEQARVHNLIGQALHRMGKVEDALKSFESAIECDANLGDAYSNRANMLSELGRNSEALSSFDLALAIDPISAPDWINRGATLHSAGRLDEAIASYDKAIELDPDFCVPHCNRGHVLTDLGRDGEALEGYDRAIALEPKMAEAYLARALALKRLSRLDDALASVEKAIGIRADVAKMHEARASLLRSLGREDDARAADTRAAELQSKKNEPSQS